jgi:tripartite-type tricarboxylate transporter receptor subunit TctC
VSSAKRTPLLPEVPPISDTLPGFEAQGWTGILAPPATPRGVIDKLNAALKSSLAKPDVRERLEGQGFEVVGSTAEEFASWLRVESDKWSRIIRDLKITLD